MRRWSELGCGLELGVQTYLCEPLRELMPIPQRAISTSARLRLGTLAGEPRRDYSPSAYGMTNGENHASF